MARQAESCHQRQVLQGLQEVQAAGLSQAEALRCARISRGTLRNWRRRQQTQRPLPLRGRPPRCATRDERQAALGFLKEHGSHVPLQALREQLPEVARVELDDLRRRAQRVARWRRDRYRGRLIWKHVGAVWSMDFTETSEYIEGTDRWILAIRDLASGYQLAWLSCAQATAEGVVQVLVGLFVEHGPPLVLKSDNGSQFIAQETWELLLVWIVAALFNPPCRPAYNGGLERTHPILKAYTAAAALAHGRPAAPAREDLEIARADANRFTRRLGPNSPTADELWRDRPPIDDALRRDFQATLRAERRRARAARGLAADVMLSHYQQAAVDRDAVRDALLAHGLLEIQPRRRQRGARRRATAQGGTSPRDPAVGEPVSAALAPPLPVERAAITKGDEVQKSSPSTAPRARESCTIASASVAAPCPDHDPPDAGPAHGEPVLTNVLRRCITPLIDRLRCAMIR